MTGCRACRPRQARLSGMLCWRTGAVNRLGARAGGKRHKRPLVGHDGVQRGQDLCAVNEDDLSASRLAGLPAPSFWFQILAVHPLDDDATASQLSSAFTITPQV